MSKLRQRHRFRLFLLRWHRRVGVVIALLVIVLVVTGIALNHTSELKLDRITVRAPWLLALYGIETEEPVAYPVGGQWLIQAGRHLFLDETEVASCDTPLVGSAATAQLLVAVCEEELIVLTREGRLVEQLGSVYGIPVPLTGTAAVEGEVWLQSGANWYLLDMVTLTWTSNDALAAVLEPARPATLPAALQDVVAHRLLGEPLNLERVMLDLHSGRLFGRATVWLVDLAGLFLLVIALSGCYVWLTKPGRFRRRENNPKCR